MALTGYFVAMFLHILFVFTWLSVGVIDIILKRVYKDVMGTEQEIKLFKYSLLGNNISIVAAFGILFTGGFMVERGNWGWFPFETNLWLAVKQIIWIILFVGGGMIISPLHSKLTKLLAEKGPVDQIRQLIKTMNFRIQMLSGLIIVNIFLATTKPF